MTHAFPDYREALLGIEDATELEERLILNWKALAILHLEMHSYPAEWQAQFEPWFTTALKSHGMQMTHIYGQLWMGNDLEWKGVSEGLVRRRRPGLASERG